MAEAAASFACPACKKRFGWKPDLSGKKVRCSKCNLKLRVPSKANATAEALEPIPGSGSGGKASAKPAAKKPAPEDDFGGLDLDDLMPREPAAPPALPPVPIAGSPGKKSDSIEVRSRGTPGDDAGGGSGGKCPSCGNKVKPGAVICINCGFNLQAGKKMKTAVETGGGDNGAPAGPPGGLDLNDERWKRLSAQVKSREEGDNPSDFKEKKAPPILLAAGIALCVLDAFLLMYGETDYLIGMYGTEDPGTASVARLIGAGLSFLLGLPFMLIGLVIVAKMFGSAFGGMMMATYKLAGVLLFTIGVGQVVDSVMAHLTEGVGDFIGYLSLAVNFVAFWGASSFAFDDMEFGEVAMLYVLTFILPYFILGFVLLTMLASFM